MFNAINLIILSVLNIALQKKNLNVDSLIKRKLNLNILEICIC